MHFFQLKWNVKLPQTVLNAQMFVNGKISNSGSSTFEHKFWINNFVSSLKIGMDDCSTFKLNAGFMSFRTGFQTDPSFLNQRKKFL